MKQMKQKKNKKGSKNFLLKTKLPGYIEALIIQES